MPESYTRTQIVLHWLVALLVLAQYLDNGAIGSAWRAMRRGLEEVPGGPLVAAHVVIGVAILAFGIWRVVLRLTHGAPPPPAGEPRILRILAAATHGGLYLLLLLLPVSGLVAWFGGIGQAADAHSVLKSLLMAVVLLHVAGALYQRFVLRSDVLARMVRASR